MGLFDRLRGKTKPPPAENRTERWLRDKISECVQNRDAVALAHACAAFAGHGAMVFGMVLSDFPGRAEVNEVALAGLARLISDLPDGQCDAVFEVVDRAQLPVDIAARRAKLVASRRAAFEATFTKLRTAIETSVAGPLVDACAALRGHHRQVFGIQMLDDEGARQELLELGLARLRAIIPALTDEQCEDVFPVIRQAHLPIDITARTAELAGRRRSEREQVIAKATGLEPRDEALERAIVANHDADAYAVLADWLHDRGHPRGELIALQLRAESDPSLGAAARAHLASHAELLLGPLAPHVVTYDGRKRDAFEWVRGFIHHARLSVDENIELRGPKVAELLGLLLLHPSGRYLAELDLGINGSPTDDTLDDVIEVLVTQPPPHLRALLLGDFDRDQCELSWYNVGNVGPLWAAVQPLRRLVIRGGSFELGTIEHAGLEHLEVQTGGLSLDSANAIANARLPRLRHLDVWYGDPNYGGDATIVEAMQLLRRTDLPDLVHLGLMNAAFTDELCAQLASAPLAAQLTELDLSLGTMSDAGAAALVAAAKKLPKLATVDVSESYLSPEGIEALESAFRTVVVRDQRFGESDDDDRYPAVGE